MSIRLIAKELYRLHQAVESLERQLNEAAPERRGEIEDRLRKTRAERDRVRYALEGKKKS